MNYYKDIIDNLKNDDIKTLLMSLGAEDVEERNDCLVTNTICHNIEGGSKKLYYYFNSHMFYCYTECGSMTPFKFLEHYYETRDITYDWYKDVYCVIKNCSTSNLLEGFVAKKKEKLHDKYKRRQLPELKIYPKGILDIFTINYTSEWLNDGISATAMDKFNIKYSISRNKIIIPHFDINGNLIGIRGRALNPDEVEQFGKYMPINIEGTWYSHPLSLNLYGLYENKDNIKKSGICYLFEAEKSVLQYESFNEPNCAVAVCGSNFNIYQLKLLLKECHPQEIIICFDKEQIPYSDDYFNKLYHIGEKYKKYCDFSFIYDKKNLLDLKDSPTDKGEDIFKELLNERVRVR